MLKKLTAALVTFLALAVILLPGLIGLGVESEFERAHEPIADALGAPLDVVAYERGWFGATARVCAAPPTDPAVVCADYDIQHGPVLWRPPHGLGWFAATLVPEWNENVQAQLEPLFGEANPVAIAIGTGFGKTVRLHLRSAAVDGTHDGTEVRFAPLVVDSSFDVEARRVSGEARWPAANLGDTVAIEDFRTTFDTTELDGWWTGETVTTFAAIATTDDDGTIRATDFRLASRSGIDEAGKIVAEGHVDAGQLMLPALPEPMKLGLTIGLSGVELATVQAIRQASQGRLAVDPQAQQALLLEALLGLARGGGTLDLSRLDVRMGEESLNGSLRFDVETRPAGAGDTVADLLRRTSAKARLRSTRSLAVRLLGANGLQQWLATGLARPENDDILVDVDFADGNIRVGERDLPLELILALLLGVR